MMRLILLIAVVAMAVIAVNALLGTMQAVTQVATGKEGEEMPAKFKRITYILLVVLLFGVTAGWLGAA